ncbi:MAG TPA: hypothetical protein VFM25_09260 [Verrucomicrobiae bacterium]|nr:hypothetical protein [Verrucomicrobiae bacterium]
MQKKARPKVLLYQNVGFLAIIGLSWLDAFLDLSSLIFGEYYPLHKFHPPILQTLFICAVWLLVATSTRRVLERVKYLEGFMKVCAWCRRIDSGGRWMPIEQFLEQSFDTPTSHGICRDCLSREKAAAESAKKARLERELKKS